MSVAYTLNVNLINTPKYVLRYRDERTSFFMNAYIHSHSGCRFTKQFPCQLFITI
jgi:hypothetical protein